MNNNKNNNNNNSKIMSSSEMKMKMKQQQQNLLRQRRTRILQDQAKEYHEQQQIKNVVLKANASNNKQIIWKIYAVIMLALIVTLISAIQYTRPHLISKLFGSTTQSQKQNQDDPNTQFQPYYIATLYPPEVILDRDLPRFFGTYSIATKENEFAIQAVQNVQKSRLALKKGTGKLKVWLKAWDDYTIQQLLDRNICGSDFTIIYNQLSALASTANTAEVEVRKNDLIMWCILTTRLADGFFLENIEIIDNGRFSPILLLAKKRGMIVKKSSRDSNKYVHSFYVHPRNTENYDPSSLAILPSKVLNYLLDDAQQSLILNDDQKEIPPTIEEYRLLLQSHINDLLMSQNNIANYLELTEICFITDKKSTQEEEEEPPPIPIGAIAKTKSCNIDDNDGIIDDDEDNKNDECCYFVLPEPEAKRYMIKKENDDKED